MQFETYKEANKLEGISTLKTKQNKTVGHKKSARDNAVFTK